MNDNYHTSLQNATHETHTVAFFGRVIGKAVVGVGFTVFLIFLCATLIRIH